MKFLFSAKGFASMQGVLSATASARYFMAGDVRHGLYWLSATVITAVVTF